MKPRTLLNSYLQSISPEMKLNADGLCLVKRDDETVVLVEEPVDSPICHLAAIVMPLPSMLSIELFETVLALNQFGRPLDGSWLALDLEIQTLMLCHNLSVQKVSADEFQNIMQNFFNTIDVARNHLSQFIQEDVDNEAFLFQVAEKTKNKLPRQKIYP